MDLQLNIFAYRNSNSVVEVSSKFSLTTSVNHVNSRMIDKILSRPEFQTEPPVLVDIGASGQLHGRWKAFAKYAVCIAFDADDRDFGYVESESSHFRKLYTFNNIVTGPDPPNRYRNGRLLPDRIAPLFQPAYAPARPDSGICLCAKV